MRPAEVFKRMAETIGVLHSRVKYKNPSQWPYQRFAEGRRSIAIEKLPGHPVRFDPRAIWIYSDCIDSTRPIDWQRSNIKGKRWPVTHWSRINYRPENPYGDIRINWELNRLQFLPHLSLKDPHLAINVLRSWLNHNPYLHGPAYVASMEVALRWISIYRSVCLMDRLLDQPLVKAVTGLAVASGKYILSRLSTHSSAGNHLIVESVGLFWAGKALGDDPLGKRWRRIAREILWREVLAQISSDGTGKEQSFWYLGFVVDAVFHYILLEDRSRIPAAFWSRIERALDFISLLVLSDKDYPDFGDRDDGYVFRADVNYHENFFRGLLDAGSYYFARPEWNRCRRGQANRIKFWVSANLDDMKIARKPTNSKGVIQSDPFLKTFPQGGMTLMKWGELQMLFRHAPLGLGNTCGHGHADALSLLLSFQNTPVLIDLGSGQYNGDQQIRNFFRSTAAHNTIELEGQNQAQITGPFLWKESYCAKLVDARNGSGMMAEGFHDGYTGSFQTIHQRRVVWLSPTEIEVMDSLAGPGGSLMKGFFHLGACENVTIKQNELVAAFPDFMFSIVFPECFRIELFRGSQSPFMGWRSGRYGNWNPTYSISFSYLLEHNFSYQLRIIIEQQAGHRVLMD